jgi:hypothetical protein
MGSLRYLNAILTILTLLLACELWTKWTASSVTITTPQAALAQGIPNAGAQRKEMIEQLAKLNTQVGFLADLLRSGQVRIQTDAPQAGDKK